MATQKRSREDSTLRPRIGGRKGKVPVQRTPRFIPSVLERAHVRFIRVAGLGTPRVPHKHITRGVADVRTPRLGARRCIVKARIVRMGPHGLKAARLHLAYVERDGVDRDGSPGRLYGSDSELDRSSLSEPIRGERHQFRFIVSPEDDIDLTTFTRELMSRVESDLSVRLRWGAVNHYDTANPHAHVIVRGVDKRGHEVWIDRTYISERMRWRAQNLLTDELGPRLDFDVDRQLAREVTQERVETTLDRRIPVARGLGQTLDMARSRAGATTRSAGGSSAGCGSWSRCSSPSEAAPGGLAAATELAAGSQRASEERAEIVARIDRAVPERNRELTEIIGREAEREAFEGHPSGRRDDELRGGRYVRGGRDARARTTWCTCSSTRPPRTRS